MLPGSSEVPHALGGVAAREGHWDERIVYWEGALTLDPRNLDLLADTAWTYAMLRQFPAALKLYDRALDIAPDDPDLSAAKASVYQAKGNLREAARLVAVITEPTPSEDACKVKITKFRHTGNYT